MKGVDSGNSIYLERKHMGKANKNGEERKRIISGIGSKYVRKKFIGK